MDNETQGLISYKEVERLTSLTRRTIHRRIESGNFPKPIQIGPQRKAFVRGEVLEWIENLIATQR
jgi:prophage regulatory protein